MAGLTTNDRKNWLMIKNPPHNAMSNPNPASVIGKSRPNAASHNSTVAAASQIMAAPNIRATIARGVL